MTTMSSTFTVESAQSVTDHVTGSTSTMVRWRLSPEIDGPVVLGDDGAYYAVTKVVYADNGTGDSISLIGHPVTAKNHKPLTHDRKLPIPLPVADSKAALLTFAGEGGLSLEPVRISKSSVRRTIDDRFFALQRSGA